MGQETSERRQVVDRLKELLETRGLKVADVERQLKRGRGYLGDALRGSKKLTVEAILEVLALLGVAPEEVFALPRRQHGWRSEIAELDERGPGATGGALPPSIREASLVVQAVVLLLAEKGMVGLDEVEARHRELSGLPPRGPGAHSPRR